MSANPIDSGQTENLMLETRKNLVSEIGDETSIAESRELLRAFRTGKAEDALAGIAADTEPRLSIDWDSLESIASTLTPFESLQKSWFATCGFAIELGVVMAMPLLAYLISLSLIGKAVTSQAFPWIVTAIVVSVSSIGICCLAAYVLTARPRPQQGSTGLPTLALIPAFILLGCIVFGLSFPPTLPWAQSTETAWAKLDKGSFQDKVRYVISDHQDIVNSNAGCNAYIESKWSINLDQLLTQNDASSLNTLGLCMERQDRIGDAILANTAASFLAKDNLQIKSNNPVGETERPLAIAVSAGEIIYYEYGGMKRFVSPEAKTLFIKLKNNELKIGEFQAKTASDFNFLGIVNEGEEKKTLALKNFRDAVEADSKNLTGQINLQRISRDLISEAIRNPGFNKN